VRVVIGFVVFISLIKCMYVCQICYPLNHEVLCMKF
jgi:hypothetical protein